MNLNPEIVVLAMWISIFLFGIGLLISVICSDWNYRAKEKDDSELE